MVVLPDGDFLKNVLNENFGESPKEMYEYACNYDPGKDGPRNFGVQFRELIGTRDSGRGLGDRGCCWLKYKIVDLH